MSRRTHGASIDVAAVLHALVGTADVTRRILHVRRWTYSDSGGGLPRLDVRANPADLPGARDAQTHSRDMPRSCIRLEYVSRSLARAMSEMTVGSVVINVRRHEVQAIAPRVRAETIPVIRVPTTRRDSPLTPGLDCSGRSF